VGLAGDTTVEECTVGRSAGAFRPVAEGSLGARTLRVGFLKCMFFRVHLGDGWRVEEAMRDD